MNTTTVDKYNGLNNFDTSILNKVKAFFPNTVYANTAITYNTVYHLLDDVDNKLKVPLINIYRPNGFTLVPMQNFAAKRRGVTVLYEDGQETKAIGARYITVDLMYQFDIYAKRLEDINIMVEDFIKTFNFEPYIEITHRDRKTLEEFKEIYEIEYLSGPTEQSEFDNNNHTYRQYIQYEIKNARIYDFTDYEFIEEVDVELKLVDVDTEPNAEHDI